MVFYLFQVRFIKLLANPCMRKRFLIMVVNWISVVMCYNGLTLNTANLGGSLHLNMALGVAIEIPAYMFCTFATGR